MSTIQACRLANPAQTGATLSAMIQASDYWTPDNHSQFTSLDHTVGMAKAQLYNTLNAQKDTLFNASEFGLTITSNARIDNRSALLDALGLKASNPCVETDSQLILHCYIKWGASCAQHLRGDFVFILWDEPQQKFFCARDHFGVKVLFYGLNAQGTMISNEHNAFFTSNWCDEEQIDERWLVDNLWQLGPTDFRSPHPDICVLPPAHTLEIDQHGARLTQYWQLAAKNDWQHFTDKEHLAELEARFEKAVIRRLDSTYPLGAELSEGIDSNGIAGFAARHISPAPIHTFSYQCAALNDENRPIWEDTYADIEAMLAMHQNLKPVWVAEEQVFNEATKQHAEYRVLGGVLTQGSQASRKAPVKDRHIRVMLSGWGGDHCVTCPGDEYANELLNAGQLRRLYRLLIDKHNRGRGGRPVRTLASLIVRRLIPTPLRFILDKRNGLHAAMLFRAKNHFLHPKWRSRYDLDHKLKHFLQNYNRATVQQHEIRELFEIALTNRMTKEELNARQWRYEYRYPMADVDLVEFAHSLPSRLKILNGIERYPFRYILQGVTTPRIQWRRKADVDHPNIDRDSHVALRKKRLAKALGESSLMRKYGREDWTAELIESLDTIGLSHAERMLDIENYYDAQAMPPSFTQRT